MDVLSDSLLAYQAHVNPRELSNLRSILKRYILPDLLQCASLQYLQHKKLDFVFEHIPLAGFIATADPIFQNQVQLRPGSRTLTVEKSQWKRFCNWLQAQEGYIPDPVPLPPDLEKSPSPYTHIPLGMLSTLEALKNKKVLANQFSLLERDWPPKLRAEIESFDSFCQTVTQWRKQPVRPATLRSYHTSIERVLGCRHRVKGIAIETLALTDLLDVPFLKEYEEWSRNRGIASSSLKQNLSVAVPIAKWHFHQTTPNENYQNPEPVKALRQHLKTIVDLGDRPRVSDAAYAERELTLKQCWEILQYLCWRCKDLEKQHGITDKVIDAWMDYLIVAILVTTGARQREIRELRRHYLSVEGDFIFVTLPPEGHKTGSKTGKSRKYPLFIGPMHQTLTADFQHYLEFIRPQNLNHDRLFFTRRNRATKNGQVRRGTPIQSASYLSNRVAQLIACVTAHLYGIENAKWTAPHDFRRIIATWVCTYGEPKHLAIFADLLGHSMEMLVKIYNMMHPGELAQQSPIAFDEIAAREERFNEIKTLGTTQAATSFSEMRATIQVTILQKLVQKLWYRLTQHRQTEVVASLSPVEREVIDAL